MPTVNRLHFSGRAREGACRRTKNCLVCAGFLQDTFLMKFIVSILLAAFTAVAATAAEPVTNSAPRLVIVKAVYGDLNDANATVDVTRQIGAHVKDDAVSMSVGNDTFDDPASGATKSLKVDYTVDGVAGTKIFYENGLLRLSVKDKPIKNNSSKKLVIRKAFYGDLPDGNFNDVTLDVSQMVKDDALTVLADDDDFGNPCGGAARKLRVDYTLDGKDASKTVGMGETIRISAAGG